DHGEYRTKRVILEIYDEMTDAALTGVPYQTRLDPPPADPRVAHPAREGGNVIQMRVRGATTTPTEVAQPAVVVPDHAAVGAGAWERTHTTERGDAQL